MFFYFLRILLYHSEMISYLNLMDIEHIRESLNLEDAEKKFNYKGGLELTLDMVQDLYNDIESNKEKIIAKSYYLLKEITKGHFFNGGNKRTALLTARVFLNLNNYSLNYDNGEGFLLTISIFYDRLNEKKVKEWLVNHMEAKQ